MNRNCQSKPFTLPATRIASNRAFSLIELLTVIGILTVLIALAVIGFRVVGTASREKVTDAQLENLKSMLAEFELTQSVGNLFPTPLVAVGHWVETTNTYAKTVDANSCQVAAVLPGNDGLLLEDTARTIARLRTNPKNKASIEALAADRVQAQSFSALSVSPKGYASANLPAGNAVVLLDGNGRPIYFVPGGGLTGVNRAYKGTGDRADAASYEQPGGTIFAPDHRPFWVSPGPDGNLVSGDDNIYSFGK